MELQLGFHMGLRKGTLRLVAPMGLASEAAAGFPHGVEKGSLSKLARQAAHKKLILTCQVAIGMPSRVCKGSLQGNLPIEFV